MNAISRMTADGHHREASWRWFRRWGLTAAGLVALGCLGACGPSTNEPPEIQQWMLGVFSNHLPVDHSDTDEIIQYHVYDDFTVAMIFFNGIRNEVGEYRRRWEPRSDDAFAMFPAEEEPASGIISEYMVRPREGASVGCGPYEVIKFHVPTTSQPGPQPNPQTIHRGAVCARPYDCTPPPDDPDACFGFAYTLEWCDEPPPPCEDADG